MANLGNSSLGSLPVRLGLGLLRLGTAGRPSADDAIALLHCALDQGLRLLDTADVYCLDEDDRHYGERLVRRALECWHGPREEVQVLTKVGLARPKGRWVPEGRPERLRTAVEGSLRALGVERLFVLQLHARDPRVPLEETLAALAELQRAGKVEHLGLCNTSAGEVIQAERHFRVACVQNELSVLERKSAQEGLLAFTQARGIPFLAHRPLGGHARVARLAKNQILSALAQRHACTPHEIALAALLAAGPHVIPLVGATRPQSIRSSLAALRLHLDASDHAALSIRYSFAPKPEATALVHALAPTAPAEPTRTGTVQSPASHAPASVDPMLSPPAALHVGQQAEVVVLMGIQGAGKTMLVSEYVDKGYARLNRDLLGGRLDDLVPRMVEFLRAGQRRIVLDNTYPTRISRFPVIHAARVHGVPVRCRHLHTPLTEARINIVLRMLERYGRPLGPDEMKALAKKDPNLPPPAALMRWTSSFEPPALDEGFAAVETIPFVRRPQPARTEKGLLLDVDGTLRKTRSGEIYPRHADDIEILPGRREVLARWVAAGYRLFFVSNQSGIASGKLTHAAAEACFLRTAELLQLPVTGIAYCPHPAFPVGCYCRKPMPGLGVYLMERHQLAREHLVVVGDMASDAEFAAGLGARYVDAGEFFGGR